MIGGTRRARIVGEAATGTGTEVVRTGKRGELDRHARDGTQRERAVERWREAKR